MSLTVLAGPQVEPITLAEAKANLRVDIDDDDDLINGLIVAARQRFERVTGRQAIEATFDLRLVGFPCGAEIVLPKPPLISVTSITYVDTAGVTQTWGASNYQVEALAGPYAQHGRVRPAYATNWPSARTETLGAVVVRFKAGYGVDAGAVPVDAIRAMHLLMHGWYYGDTESGVRAVSLLTPFKTFD